MKSRQLFVLLGLPLATFGMNQNEQKMSGTDTMKVFFTNSTQHLSNLFLPAKRTIKQFVDGEVFVRVDESDMHDKDALIISSTPPPAENILGLTFLLDALRQSGARNYVLMTYFGYARQDKPQPGEAFSCRVLCNMIKQFKPEKISIIHPHNSVPTDLLGAQKIMPVDLVKGLAENVDVLVAPDAGSLGFVEQVRMVCEKPLPVVSCQKQRPQQDQAEIVTIAGSVENKKVLIIDDMISTAGTMCAVSQAIKDKGAKEINVYATHGLFSGTAFDRIEKSPIDRVYVSSTLEQKRTHPKLTVLDIGSVIKKHVQTLR